MGKRRLTVEDLLAQVATAIGDLGPTQPAWRLFLAAVVAYTSDY